LVERAARGEEIVIAKGGHPVARLIPVTSTQNKRRRRVGALKGKIWISPDFDAPLPPEIAKAFGIGD
jgi:antitoxin (DNA-binding transcriptional repressor) of toxin-antitoxin stability system